MTDEGMFGWVGGLGFMGTALLSEKVVWRDLEVLCLIVRVWPGRVEGGPGRRRESARASC